MKNLIWATIGVQNSNSGFLYNTEKERYKILGHNTSNLVKYGEIMSN